MIKMINTTDNNNNGPVATTTKFAGEATTNFPVATTEAPAAPVTETPTTEKV